MINWYKRLFETEITESYKEEIEQELKEEFKLFYNCYNDNLSHDTFTLLNNWYYSSEGQKELLRFIKDFWCKINNNSLDAMPAHDARHALFKVPIYSLKYIESEKVERWEKVGVIGALGHDFGRWAEEHIFGNAQEGSMHSRMSYVLLKEFLENYEIPIEIKKSILNSVLKHTTGANKEESMPIKLTVSPDRDQLVGPEMILRIIHHKPKENSLNVFFDSIGQKSVIQTIVRMYFLRLPGPLFTIDEELRNSYRITLVFCLMNTSLEKIMEYHKTYAKEYFNEEIFIQDLIYAEKEINEINNNNITIDVESALLNLLSAKNICPKEEYKILSLKKIDNLTKKQKIILAKSLTWVNEQRLIMDSKQYLFLKEFNKNTNENWLKWISEQLYTKGF